MSLDIIWFGLKVANLPLPINGVHRKLRPGYESPLSLKYEIWTISLQYHLTILFLQFE